MIKNNGFHSRRFPIVWTPSLYLFGSGEPGAWYDPSDMSTLFQDVAGTVPVTAIDQPVGLMLDKSGRGNHASQSVEISKPILKQDLAGLYYLQFDGSNDFLSTPSIDFTATNNVTVFAGLRKLSDAGAGIFAELSENVGVNNGSFSLVVPASPAPNIQFVSRGTAITSATSTGLPAPITVVVTGIARITSPLITLRINGAAGATSAANQGTGNYGNYPVFIGRRGGTSFPFNGHLYSLIIRGAQSTDVQIADAEKWVNSKTNAF